MSTSTFAYTHTHTHTQTHTVTSKHRGGHNTLLTFNNQTSNLHKICSIFHGLNVTKNE